VPLRKFKLLRPYFFGLFLGNVIIDGEVSLQRLKYPLLDRSESHNESILIEGSSGSGKNFLAFLLGVKLSLFHNQPLLFFDLKGDYRGSNDFTSLYRHYFLDTRVFVPAPYLLKYSETDKKYYEVTDAFKFKESVLTPEIVIRLSKLAPDAQYTGYLERAFRELDVISIASLKDKIKGYVNLENKKSMSVLLSGLERLEFLGLFSDDGFDFKDIFTGLNRSRVYVFSFVYPDLDRFVLYGLLLNQLFEHVKRNPECYPILILDELKLSAPARRFKDVVTDYSSLVVSYIKEMGRGKLIRIFICQSRKDLLESFIDSPCPIEFVFYARRKCVMTNSIKKLKAFFYVGNCPLKLKT